MLYTLKPEQFVVTADGVPQTIHLDEETDSRGLSLVVVLQCSRSAIAEFAKLPGLASMIDAIAGGGPREVALVSFGSEPTVLQDFTPDPDAIHTALGQLEPCTDDANAAILDAVAYSTAMLEHRPDTNRHAILLISETRDHGSHHKPETVISFLGRTNALVDSVAFAPMKTQFLSDLRHSSGNGPDFLPLFLAAVQAVRSNAPKELSRLSGGEYINFTTQKGFERGLSDIANHIHNYYLISFQPHAKDDAPVPTGLHAISVTVPDYPSARIRFRESYWTGDPVTPAPDPNPAPNPASEPKHP